MKCETCGKPTHCLDNWLGEWDYEAVLSEYEVTVGLASKGWCLMWYKGFMHIPTDNEVHARKAAALFVELYQRGVSASFADTLMDGYLYVLEKS